MKPTRAKARLLCVICLLSILCMLLSGCNTAKNEAVTNLRQLDGQKIGVMTGSSFDVHTDNLIEDADTLVYMMIFVEEENVEKIANEVIDHLNLASVLCQKEEIPYTFYAGEEKQS